jgi:hypothetical protein
LDEVDLGISLDPADICISNQVSESILIKGNSTEQEADSRIKNRYQLTFDLDFVDPLPQSFWVSRSRDLELERIQMEIHGQAVIAQVN